MSGESITSLANVNVVVDNSFPSPPGVGMGALFKDTDSSLFSMGGAVHIFTARQGLNNIQGLIHGAPFVLSSLFMDTTQEQLGTYFPSLFGSSFIFEDRVFWIGTS